VRDMKWRDILIGAGIATLLYYIFDEELQPIVDKSKGFLVGILGKDAETFNAGANGTAGVNEKGDVLIGTNRVYQIPINSGGTSLPVITPLATPVAGFGSYVGQTAYPMGAAENNLSELIDGASWMNAAAYTNASFGQNYSGRAVGNE